MRNVRLSIADSLAWATVARAFAVLRLDDAVLGLVRTDMLSVHDNHAKLATGAGKRSIAIRTVSL